LHIAAPPWLADSIDLETVPFDELPDKLGVSEDVARLKAFIKAWVDDSADEVQQLLRWQLLARSKYFRSLTIFACHRAVSDTSVSDRLLRSAVALELLHNVSLIIDDIVDRSRYRRGKLTLHCRFGELPAIMVSGYLTAGGFALVADDEYAVRLLAELMQRLGVAECFQWRVRRQPLGVEDWRAIAGEDTGSMFEICARLGARSDRLRAYGRLLGMLYHGCDDVGDVRGLAALGGGGDEDVRDGILTLPAAIAIRSPDTAALFRRPSLDAAPELRRRMAAALPEAESYLNQLAAEARVEATRNIDQPGALLKLVAYTRALSKC
jgi:geranylgeranyl pyrophosphate synthase